MGERDRLKVIGFDSWTKGAHHYQRLVEACEAEGIDLALIHIGSLGDEKGRPTTEVIGGLEVRDINHYPRRTYAQVLDTEKPDAVILLSTGAFTHRAFLRRCRARGIPTIHLFHGVQLIWEDTSSGLSLGAALARVWALRAHIIKHATHSWPVYARTLWDTRATLRDWGHFAIDVSGRAFGIVADRAAEDSKADKACVYLDAEIEFAVTRYGYEASDVTAVGDPDLVAFGVSPNIIGSCLDAPHGRNVVLYIETAYTDIGRLFYSDAEYVAQIRQTGEELSRCGHRLRFKPHPVRQGKPFLSELRRAGIDICDNRDFVPTLATCCACITEPSTVALIPALMGLPLFLACYGKLRSDEFGRLLRSYPRADWLNDIGEYSRLLMRAQASGNAAKTKAWIAAHTGPLPAEQMPQRVVDVLQSLIAAHNGRR